MNILIIEDDPADSEALVSVLLANNFSVVGVSDNIIDGQKILYQNSVDVIITDVFLNGRPDGIKLAETVNSLPSLSKPFLFLTNFRDRQIFKRAHLILPFSFLLKPFNELAVLYAIEVTVEKFYAQRNEFTNPRRDYFFIKKKESFKKIKITDILFIEVESRYCNIVTENEKFLIQISLSKILELLDIKQFRQTHRNYVANIEKIQEIVPGDNLIILYGNHQVPLSDKYKGFINQYNILK